MNVQVSEARQVAEAVEQLLLTLARQRHGRDPEPGSLSTFQSIALSAVADDGPLRLGALADTLGTTDATASRTVDALQVRGLAERRPDPCDARGVIVAATLAGGAEVRRRRRRLEGLAARALGDLTPDEASRLVHALAELRTLLDRR
jgi:DNA-binding MarR family transcriptional regulator